MPDWHESRLWSGRDVERFPECTCEEEPCGFVTPDQTCPQHSIGAMKSIRRSHLAENCPARRIR